MYAYYNTDILHRLAWRQENPCLLPGMPTKKHCRVSKKERMRTTSFDPLSALDAFRQLGRASHWAKMSKIENKKISAYFQQCQKFFAQFAEMFKWLWYEVLEYSFFIFGPMCVGPGLSGRWTSRTRRNTISS